ncbi:3-hydroxyacyl-ACP dehydratase FabZ [Aminicella lysinilytica]|uniref:3-hydroxyacyl-ACP dehydratase FabZ n=1 Tax=Aminicella lysinilytica TaxID=433323 RepID=UPI0026E9D5A8|nr:3-hydroxyacyl-ACP dehydratase FabZ [Aminicella lysinilytica]
MELNIDEIREILPHRYPFLLVDRITNMEPGISACGIKCVSANEMQFVGHFPGKSIMPGVLIMEALAQTGAIAILSQPENKGKLVVFGGIKDCRFKRPVVPGDVLELSCQITGQRGNVGFGKAVATVEGDVAACGSISFAIV